MRFNINSKRENHKDPTQEVDKFTYLCNFWTTLNIKLKLCDMKLLC